MIQTDDVVVRQSLLFPRCSLDVRFGRRGLHIGSLLKHEGIILREFSALNKCREYWSLLFNSLGHLSLLEI